jgi:outer membrane lipoprotein-sorting protein
MGMSPLTAYSVTYNVKTTYGGDTQTATIKEAISGTKMKYDITTANSQVRSVMIMTGSKYYVCTLGVGQDTCFEMATNTAQPTAADQASESAKSFENTPNIAYDGTKTIAGVTAYCYKTSSNGGDYKFCLDKSHGMMLGAYMTVSGTTTEMEATSFSTAAPSDSEFALPAAVQQMPSYGG